MARSGGGKSCPSSGDLRQKMLGNAVPSLLGDRRDPGLLKLLPPVRRPMPGPEPLAPLPAKYRSHIADHQDHPGEGKLRAKRKKQAQKAEAELALVTAAE